MRTDAFGLRTWWLLGCLVWALAMWAAALAGLGSRIAPAADTAGGAVAVPALTAQPPQVLDVYDSYSEISARPLFAEDRQPHPFFLGSDRTENVETARLTGVLITPALEMATLTTEQGQSIRLRLGAEAVSGWQLLALEPRSATVSGPAGTQTLELSVFNGIGGEPPTPLLNSTPGGQPPPAALPTPPAPAPSTPTGGPRAPANAATPPAQPVTPALPAPEAEDDKSSAAQTRDILRRIQERRKLLQQTSDDAPTGQNK